MDELSWLLDYRLPSTCPTLCSKKIHVPPKIRILISGTLNKPFIGLWQPQKAGLKKHTGKSCIHKITLLEMI